MNQPLDPETCRRLFRTYRSWFGPPPVAIDDNTIDGRMRFREAVAMGIQVPPAIQCDTVRVAIKLLCTAGHYDRAKAMMPLHWTTYRPDELAAVVGCDREVIAPLFAKRAKPTTSAKQYTRAARRDALMRVAALYRAAVQSTGTVSCDELRVALGRFL